MKILSDAKTPMEAVRDINTILIRAINKEKEQLNQVHTNKEAAVVQGKIDALCGVKYQINLIQFMQDWAGLEEK